MSGSAFSLMFILSTAAGGCQWTDGKGGGVVPFFWGGICRGQLERKALVSLRDPDKQVVGATRREEKVLVSGICRGQLEERKALVSLRDPDKRVVGATRREG
jgi:hypothetical protein